MSSDLQTIQPTPSVGDAASTSVSDPLSPLHAAQALVADLDLPAGDALSLPADFLLSIVVPAYNEERTIASVVNRLLQLPLPVEIIVVDDGSRDGTPSALRDLQQQHAEVQVLTQSVNQGKGAAFVEALRRPPGHTSLCRTRTWNMTQLKLSNWYARCCPINATSSTGRVSSNEDIVVRLGCTASEIKCSPPFPTAPRDGN